MLVRLAILSSFSHLLFLVFSDTRFNAGCLIYFCLKCNSVNTLLDESRTQLGEYMVPKMISFDELSPHLRENKRNFIKIWKCKFSLSYCYFFSCAYILLFRCHIFSLPLHSLRCDWSCFFFIRNVVSI